LSKNIFIQGVMMFNTQTTRLTVPGSHVRFQTGSLAWICVIYSSYVSLANHIK